MTPLRKLLLTGIALPLAAIAAADAFAQAGEPRGQISEMCRPGPDGTPPTLSPQDRVTCAEEAVERARRQLDRATRQNRDTAEAEQRLADAEAELAAAREALAAAGEAAPEEDVAAPADGTSDEAAGGEQAAAPPADETPEPPGEAQATAPSGDQPADTTEAEEKAATPPDGQPADEAQQQEQAAAPPSDTPPPPPDGSTVELQLQKQGNTEEIDRIRKLRAKIRRDREQEEQEQQETASAEPEAQQQEQDPDAGDDDGAALGSVVRRSGDRTIINLGGQIVIRQGAEEETDRLLYGARDADIEMLPNGFTRETITRENGSKVVTTRDANGQIVKRVRIDRRGREFVMIDDQGYARGPGARGPQAFEFDDDLPPVRIRIPRDQYIVETRRASRRQLEQALAAPPVEEVERLYSLDEVRYSQRLREKVRRIDVDTITFDFGSAAISPSQFGALTELASALSDYLEQNPWATILVEGHTDAVGSEYANLLLSDRRAEAVAVALTSYFGIPPENLVTQGYGEQFLKIDTELPERQNRRVTLRNITELVQGEEIAE